jgi:A/G-specific adenine glycosylase
VVDGNVERVMARLYRLADKRAAFGAMDGLTPARRAGDFAQGVMDLGATICTPRRPACGACPWRGACQARATDEIDRYPAKAAKRPKPGRRAIAYVMSDAAGRVWLRRRPEHGVLAGLLEVPSTPWVGEGERLIDAPPIAMRWRVVPGMVRHVFTHLDLSVEVRGATLARDPPGEGAWHAIERLAGAALPTLTRKVLAHAGIESTPPIPAPGRRSDAPRVRRGSARPRARPAASARR